MLFDQVRPKTSSAPNYYRKICLGKLGTDGECACVGVCRDGAYANSAGMGGVNTFEAALLGHLHANLHFFIGPVYSAVPQRLRRRVLLLPWLQNCLLFPMATIV